MRPKGIESTGAVAKGYRLKPETHKLIQKLQRKIKGTKDDAISRACSMFYSIILDSKRNKNNKNNHKLIAFPKKADRRLKCY